MTTVETEQRTVRVGHPGFVVPFEGVVHEFSGKQVVVAPNGKVFEECERCGGFTGAIPTFAHVYAGQCFGCNGVGVGRSHASLEAAEKNLARRAKNRAAAERRREAKRLAAVAEAEAKFAAWAGANPELVKPLTELADLWDPREGYGSAEGVDGWLYAAALDVRNGLVPAHAEAVPDLLATYLAEQEVKAASQYAGEVGDVVTVTGEVKVALVVEGNYGSSVMVVLSNGPVTVKTYSTAKWAWEVERGDTLTLTGTVKKLDEYEGTKQTVLARPKVVGG